jgi:outer membrane protein W
MITVARLLLSATILTATATTAGAEPAEGSLDHEVSPAHDALEIAIGGSVSQGAGKTGTGANVEDLAGPGGSAEIQIGHRLTPNLTLGGYGTLEGYSTGNLLNERMNDVVGASLGIKGDWHFRPARSVDPWVSAGGGMRFLWIDENNTNTTALRGIDLARVQVGVDYRISKSFAIAPVIGATATMYFDQRTPMATGFHDIDDRNVSWMFTGGLLGRFDLE